MESESERFKIEELSEVKVGNEIRWTGRAKIPGYPHGKSFVIFQAQGELVAIPSKCPHEGYKLDNAIIHSNCTVECVAHQNVYSYLPGGIPSFQIIEENSEMYLIRKDFFNFPLVSE